MLDTQLSMAIKVCACCFFDVKEVRNTMKLLFTLLEWLNNRLNFFYFLFTCYVNRTQHTILNNLMKHNIADFIF